MYFTQLDKDIKLSQDKWAKDTTDVFQTMSHIFKKSNLVSIKRNVNRKKLPSNLKMKILLAGKVRGNQRDGIWYKWPSGSDLPSSTKSHKNAPVFYLILKRNVSNPKK